MKCRALAFCFFLPVLILLFTAIPAGASERGLDVTDQPGLLDQALGTYHALVIGINDYREWNPLRTAVKDAVALRDVLVMQYGFDPHNVILLTDKDATRAQITKDVRGLALALKDHDNLLIYFAGHGQLDDLTGDGYWIPVEGLLKEPYSWISHSEIKGVLGSEKVAAKNVVIIADSCYSGTLLRGGPSLLKRQGCGRRGKHSSGGKARRGKGLKRKGDCWRPSAGNWKKSAGS